MEGRRSRMGIRSEVGAGAMIAVVSCLVGVGGTLLLAVRSSVRLASRSRNPRRFPSIREREMVQLGLVATLSPCCPSQLQDGRAGAVWPGGGGWRGGVPRRVESGNAGHESSSSRHRHAARAENPGCFSQRAAPGILQESKEVQCSGDLAIWVGAGGGGNNLLV